MTKEAKFETAVRAADKVLSSHINPDTGKTWHPGDTHPNPQAWHRNALAAAHKDFVAAA